MRLVEIEQQVKVGCLPFTQKDVRIFLNNSKNIDRINDVTKLVLLCKKMKDNNDDFKYDYSVDGENKLQHIAWSHGTLVYGYRHYGDMVVFDTTYRLNAYNMPIGIWVDMNNHELLNVLILLYLQDFLKFMNGKAPQTILTNQDLGLKEAIASEMPNTKHALCIWHIASKFSGWFSIILGVRYDDRKSDFYRLYELESRDEFIAGWSVMVNKYDLHTNRHIHNLYALREDWAKPYVKSFFTGMTTTGRSESINSFIKRFVFAQTLLTNFIERVSVAVELRDQVGEQQTMQQKCLNVNPKTSTPIEEHASKIGVESQIVRHHSKQGGRKNFHAWFRSFCLYHGGKRKTGWILRKEPRSTASDPKVEQWDMDNCIILGWMFNLMEDRIYNMFMYHDTIHGLWSALTKMHTYQFLMGLKPEFEALQAQILNTSPMPSLYEAFTTVDGDERRRLLLPPTPSPELSPPVPDQMAFAAPSGSHPAALFSELGQREQRSREMGSPVQASLSRPVEVTPPEDSPLLPCPAPILEPPPMSSPLLTSKSLPPVITTDPFPYVPRCPRSNIPRHLRSHVPSPDSSPDSGKAKREQRSGCRKGRTDIPTGSRIFKRKVTIVDAPTLFTRFVFTEKEERTKKRGRREEDDKKGSNFWGLSNILGTSDFWGVLTYYSFICSFISHSLLTMSAEIVRIDSDEEVAQVDNTPQNIVATALILKPVDRYILDFYRT
ncbi:hypothetical protein HHK36_009325 [Tetracentron sinense]|uniref:Protein FAR1-RELATED SEQUENCE n=1 Tax=Tetracentron sinense TaxID=13715 RepID=A0A834ZFB0_TETSI|nr:hypothetical protein HHK36_009325 [Tetracentron sinense]